MNFNYPRIHSARLTWAATLLVLLLQRTPVLRVLVQAEFANGIRAGQMLGALVPAAAVAAAGTVHAQTGATTWTTNPQSPVNGTVGQSLTVVFAWTGGSATPESYAITGTIPPGLTVPNATGAPGDLTLNSSAGGSFQGTPTEAGNYTVTLVAWDGPNRGEQSNGSSPSFQLQFIIAEPPVVAPSFTVQPQSATVDFGGTATFTVTVEGTPPPVLQWRKDGENLDGATAPTLTLSNVAIDDAGTYDVVATNAAGSATSAPAVLTVNPPAAPTISSQPVSLTSLLGGGAYFSVVATGSSLSYQWFRNGTPLEGKTDSSLFIASAGAGDLGDYTVRVSNPGGSVDSAPAALSLVESGNSRLINLSTRALVGTGDDFLIPGFALSGSGDKSLLIRAVGPTLGDFGVLGFLADPIMTLFDSGGTPQVTNDNWGDAPDQTAMEAARANAGAFELATGGLDASMLVNLGIGSYTVQTSGVAGGTGVALVELYDAAPPGGTSRLSNISARAQVGTGSDILIPGFVIEGDVALTLLVRAVGPTLGDFGLEGFLEDPVMTLSRGAGESSVTIAVNDDWQSNPDTAAISDIVNTVGAFELKDGGADAALLVALPPGAYTVQVAGKNDTTGVALVEIYLAE